MMAEASTEAPPFISVPFDGKKRKGKVTSHAIVINSLTPTLPIVMPEATNHLEDSSRSAPNSPERHQGKKKGFIKKHITRARSPKPSHSDPESSSPSPQPRPRWLPFKHKKRKSPGSGLNGGTPAVTTQIDSSNSSLEPEATPVDELPGTSSLGSKNGANVPEIRVSSEGHEETEYLASYDEVNGASDPYRKNSQSSSGSGLISVGTSGIGSLLSPSASGDESYLSSDIESPLSPYSGASSFTEETPGELSEEELCSSLTRKKSPSMSSVDMKDNLGVTTPTPTRESPPLIESVATTIGSPTSTTSSTDGKELKENKKGKDKPNKQTVWLKVKHAMRAWSPFAVQFKKRSYPWVQLAGHEGNFMPGGENGTIMKRSVPNEHNALRSLMDDPLRNFVPEFKRVVEQNGEVYVEMTDLLREFNDPAVMDIKMGTRTYLEEELGKKNALRKDMYVKMIEVDPNEPTAEEQAQMAITKPRYMQWRESLSSTSTLGFRIEGIKTTLGKALKDFKKTKQAEDVREALETYLSEKPSVKDSFLKRLLDIRRALDDSTFFSRNELIGSSLLFVYDSSGLSSIHMIDFGKTTPLPPDISITHSSEWVEGNHEDGYLIGLDNLIRLWKDL